MLSIQTLEASVAAGIVGGGYYARGFSEQCFGGGRRSFTPRSPDHATGRSRFLSLNKLRTGSTVL